MNRIAAMAALACLIVSVAVPATAAGAAARTSTSGARSQATSDNKGSKGCKRHYAYKNGECHTVRKGVWQGWFVVLKHKHLRLYIKTDSNKKLDIILAPYACPSSAPKNAFCFVVKAYYTSSGKEVTYIKAGFAIHYKGQLYYYHVSLNTFKKIGPYYKYTGLFAAVA